MGTHPIFQSDFDCLTVCLCIVLSDPFWLRDRSFSAARSSPVWKPEVTPTLRRVTLSSPSTQHGTDTLEFLSALRRPFSLGYFFLMPTGTTVNSNRASSLAFLMMSLSPRPQPYSRFDHLRPAHLFHWKNSPLPQPQPLELNFQGFERNRIPPYLLNGFHSFAPLIPSINLIL